MSRLPIVDARTMEKLLLALGFVTIRQILREIDLSPEEFVERLQNL